MSPSRYYLIVALTLLVLFAWFNLSDLNALLRPLTTSGNQKHETPSPPLLQQQLLRDLWKSRPATAELTRITDSSNSNNSTFVNTSNNHDVKVGSSTSFEDKSAATSVDGIDIDA